MNMNKRVAFYARVSSEQQAQAGTIESQISALRVLRKNCQKMGFQQEEARTHQ
jgi:DNA invertase Pin-like site-specific DNA recombinase